MTRNDLVNRLAAVAVLPLCWLSSTLAAAPSASAEAAGGYRAGKPDWALQVTPFLWAASLRGSISPFQHGSTVDVDKSFSEVMDHLNLGGFLDLRARYDRVVFSGNLMYVDTTDSHASGPLSAFQIPGFGVTIPPGSHVDGKVDSTQFMATLMGGYRVMDNPDFTLDLLGGIRFWHVANEVTVTASHALIGSRTASYSEDFSWVDPLIGARIFVPLTGGFSLQSEADIGGAGIGSDYTWSVLASVNYTVTDNLSASVGYKALKVDYDHHGHVYDTLLSGPAIGLTWRF